MQYISKSLLAKAYKSRPAWSHKGDFGRLLVVAGCEFLTGSPVFVSLAAYRAGCDLVFVAAPERAALIAAHAPEIMAYPLKGSYLAKSHVKEIRRLQEMLRPDAIVIGPGLWREKQTLSAINSIIMNADLPMVIDADAIRAVALKPSVLKGKKVVVTPHAGEFHSLTNFSVNNNIKQRAKAVEKSARSLRAAILLKGYIDVISDGRKTAMNKTGSPYMTKGGFGDTLSGICGALLARGVAPFDAACASAFINGKAGGLAAKIYGESVMPTDLIGLIPKVIRERKFKRRLHISA